MGIVLRRCKYLNPYEISLLTGKKQECSKYKYPLAREYHCLSVCPNICHNCLSIMSEREIKGQIELIAGIDTEEHNLMMLQAELNKRQGANNVNSTL